MKKLLAWLLTAALTLTALTALAMEPAEVVGEWYLTQLDIGGLLYNAADTGEETVMLLSDGGDASLITRYENGEEKERSYTWALVGTALELTGVDGEGRPESVQYTMEDGCLMLREQANGSIITMTYAREPAQPTVMPATVPAASETDFYGLWRIERMAVMGVNLSAAQAGLESEITVEAGKVTIRDQSGVREYVPVFSEGALSFEGPMDSRTVCRLLENGGMRTETELFTYDYVRGE